MNKLTRERNIMLAKQFAKLSIHSVANVEIPTLTFLDTEKVIDNLSAGRLRPLEVDIILGLKKSWDEIMLNDDPLSVQYIKNINREIARGQIHNAGTLRVGGVHIGGTTYSPSEVTEESLNELIDGVNDIKDGRDAATTFLVKATKAQFFEDGNKRTSLIIANKILIDRGEGLISLEGKRDKYLEKLKDYYEDESKMEEIKSFVKGLIYTSSNYLFNLSNNKLEND